MGKTSKIKKLEGVLKGLVRELEKLTPLPDQISSPVYLGTSNCISINFNATGLCDLPRRQALQRRIAACRRLIAALRASYYSENFALVAA